jgi:hypothetical protein
MVFVLFPSSKLPREFVDPSGNKGGFKSADRIGGVQYDGRFTIERNEIFFMTVMVPKELALPLPESYTPRGKR